MDLKTKQHSHPHILHPPSIPFHVSIYLLGPCVVPGSAHINLQCRWQKLCIVYRRTYENDIQILLLFHYGNDFTTTRLPMTNIVWQDSGSSRVCSTQESREKSEWVGSGNRALVLRLIWFLFFILMLDGGGLRGHKGRVSNRQQQQKHMNGWMAFDGERRTKKDQ